MTTATMRPLLRGLPRLSPLRRSNSTWPYISTSHAPSAAALKTQSIPMLDRPLPNLHDFISPTPSHLLHLSLSSQLPFLRSTPRGTPVALPSSPLPAGHHLLYFPPQLPEELLLYDGSDAEQSPGGEWVRRMWASGELEFAEEREREVRYWETAVMRERVASVEERGEGENKKLFVTFERSVWRGNKEQGKWVEEGKMEEGAWGLRERRCIVFLKRRAEEEVVPQTVKVVKPAHPPTITHTFMPTMHLLFRFSALTFNAHKIHYDLPFCVDEEKYPSALCHGPLAVVLLMELLREYWLKDGKKRVKGFSYRCMAPMPVGKPYTIGAREMEDGRVELLVLNQQGGMAVRGVATLQDA